MGFTPSIADVNRNQLVQQCFYAKYPCIGVILVEFSHFLLKSAHFLLSFPLVSSPPPLLSSPSLSSPQCWDGSETPLAVTEVGCARHSAGPISDDLHGNVWQGRDNEVPSLPTGRLSSGVLSDLSPLSRARTARTCPSPWSPGTGVERSQIRDGESRGAGLLAKHEAAYIYYITANNTRYIKVKILISSPVTINIWKCVPVHSCYGVIVSGTYDSPHVVSLICPLHRRPIHHTHPAQSDMTKCKITLIHDLQLFCDVATNKSQQCCCLLCGMQAKKKKKKRKKGKEGKKTKKTVWHGSESQDTCLRTYSIFFLLQL